MAFIYNGVKSTPGKFALVSISYHHSQVNDLQTEDLTHFLLKCSALKDEWEFFWESLFSKVEICCPHEAGTFKIFSVSLNDDSKCRVFLGGLNIPFPRVIKNTVRIYAAVSVSKLIKVRNDKLKSSTHLHCGTVRSWGFLFLFLKLLIF